MTALTPQLAERFARIALGHVEREYPNKLDHVLNGPEDARTPRDLHPIFYGSFDWHSCVHGYWLLAKLLILFPDGGAATEIRRLFNRQFTEEKVAAELDYLARPLSGGFERPYGWAWLLALQAQLRIGQITREYPWAPVLWPLAEAISDRFLGYLPKLSYPVRSGVHSNTAFALTLALEACEFIRGATLDSAIRESAIRWFWNDADCQAWEPSGEDFLSPTLVEAVLMHEVLGEHFPSWLDRFLPRLAEGEPAVLFKPAVVSDRSDGRIAHLDGLNLSRAWCLGLLAAWLPKTDPRRALMAAAANLHRDASLGAVAGDYMGEHWLASFALLALTA